MKSRKNILFGLALVAASAFGLAGFLAASPIGNSVQADTSSVYTCASMHWGMNDATLGGKIVFNGSKINIGTYTSTVDLHANIQGVTVEKFQVEDNYIATNSKGQGLMLSQASYWSIVTFTFTETIIGADIYAIAYKGDYTYLAVNGGNEVQITNAASKTTGPLDITYKKYHFDFNASHTLRIVSRKRLWIGDIALRVAQPD